MKPSNKLAVPEPKTGSAAENPLDPFAVDFFGGRSAPAEDFSASPEKDSFRKNSGVPRKKSDWHRALPRITNREAEFSAAIKNLPDDLTEKAAAIVAEAVARFSFRPAETVRCSLISATEKNLREASSQIAESPQIFFTLGCQPEKTPALIALNTDFALSVVDHILGGQDADFSGARDLSPIETAVVEFLVANILNEINTYLGEPLLYLQTGIEMSEQVFDADARGGEFVFVLEIENFNGFLTAFAPDVFLNSLDKAQNPLLKKKSRRKKIGDFEKFADAFELNLRIGATSLDADSLLFLEPDDVVLIEQPEFAPETGFSGANLQIRVGRGKNFRLHGAAEDGAPGGELNFKIKEIISEESRRKFSPVKFKMDEKENELTAEDGGETTETEVEKSDETPEDEQILPSLENVQVALRIEIAADKISLRELQSMRAGQIIALGCRPTDPVRIVTDQTDEPIASGELVEIEGQLGVRLTKVFI